MAFLFIARALIYSKMAVSFGAERMHWDQKVGHKFIAKLAMPNRCLRRPISQLDAHVQSTRNDPRARGSARNEIRSHGSRFGYNCEDHQSWRLGAHLAPSQRDDGRARTSLEAREPRKRALEAANPREEPFGRPFKPEVCQSACKLP